MAFGVGVGAGITIKEGPEGAPPGKKQNTPRAVINLKEISKEGAVKRQLQFESSEKQQLDSFEIGSVNESKLPESPPLIPIMNDHLKYFNHFSKEADE